MRTVGLVPRAGRRARKQGLVCAVMGALVVMIASVASSTAAAAPAQRAQASKSTASDSAPAAVDINSADAEKLASLPGIGPSIAQRIVDYRKEHGPYKSVDELLNVRGVGEKLLARLRDHVTVGAKGD